VQLERLHLKNFRNYPEVTLDLPQGVSVFIADNGSGKTNILESIYYLSQLKSHRLGDTQTLIRAGAHISQVIARIREKDRNEILEVQLNDGGRRLLTVDRSNVGQARKFRNKLKATLFAPEDIELVRGEAEFRRDQIDELLASYWLSRGQLRSEFDRSLKQRNSLLKEIQKSEGSSRTKHLDSLVDWNETYLTRAAALLLARRQMLDAITPRLSELYGALTEGRDSLNMQYEPKSVVYSDDADEQTLKGNLNEALMAKREVELIRGVTMVGPHRDDIEITINGLPSRTHASQGEAWSVALIWRVAAFDLLTERYQDPPVLLLDDVFTQLDEGRRQLLISRFAKAEQVLITTAVASDVPESLWNHSFQIKDGDVIAIS
jgi:DNA replication and repair protein RecF